MNSMEEHSSRPAIIALGANLPHAEAQPEQSLHMALEEMKAEGLVISRVSSFWLTPCFPAGAGPDYVNAVAVVEKKSLQSEHFFLDLLHKIEANHGRERISRWAGRTLDLDLLAMGESVLPSPEVQDAWRNLAPELQAQRAPEELILPHPRLQDRAFVLVPMAEVAPDWRHPRLGLTVREMLAALPEEERAAVKRL